MKGTGLWLLEHEKYRRWKTSPSLLWVHGPAGCGKTVLSSTVIEDNDRGTTHSTAYFFFDYKDTNKRSLQDLLASFIRQLSYGNAKAVEIALALRETCGAAQPSLAGLHSLLVDIIKLHERVTLVIDALDEAEPRVPVLEWLMDICGKQSLKLHIFATSRNELDIQKILEQSSTSLDLTFSALKDDISLYIRKAVHDSSLFDKWKTRPELLQQVEDILTAKQGGM